MRAAVLNAFDGHFDIEDIDIDKPRGREVLVRVMACGLCHSDLHMAESNFGTVLPAVFGHELAGIVIALGPDATSVAVGAHVVGSLVQYCGHCRACRDGRTYQCLEKMETLRSPQDAPRLTRRGESVTSCFGTAAFAEFALVHENQLVEIPKEVPFPQASLLGCGVITGVGAAINAAGVKPGDRVAVIGVGGVGLNVVSGAKSAGAAQIIAVDVQRHKLDFSKKFGVTDTVDASSCDAVAVVRALSNDGVDHVFEVVGSKATSQQAIQMVRKGGGVYIIGLNAPGSTIQLDLLKDFIGNQLKIQGIYMGSSNIQRDIPAYADLYLAGKLNLDDLVSRRIMLDQINEAYDELKRGQIARSIITRFDKDRQL